MPQNSLETRWHILDQVPSISPAFSPSWTNTTGMVRRRAVLTTQESAVDNALTEYGVSWANAGMATKAGIVQIVTDPFTRRVKMSDSFTYLPTGINWQGNLSLLAAYRVANTSVAAYLAATVYLLRADGTTASIFSTPGSVSQLTGGSLQILTTSYNKVANIGISSQTTANIGDRMIWEQGFYAATTATNTGYMTLGRVSGYPDGTWGDNTTPGSSNPWMSMPTDLESNAGINSQLIRAGNGMSVSLGR